MRELTRHELTGAQGRPLIPAPGPELVIVQDTLARARHPVESLRAELARRESEGSGAAIHWTRNVPDTREPSSRRVLDTHNPRYEECGNEIRRIGRRRISSQRA